VLLEKFKLDTKKDDYAASLSGGQRKLLEMARSLMVRPKLVMLDEPMAGVNPALTQSLLDHIKNLKAEGMTVLFVEHDMHMVRHIADWVVVMAEGKIVAEGPPGEVMKNPAVIDAYLGAHHDVDLGDSEGIKELAAELVAMRNPSWAPKTRASSPSTWLPPKTNPPKRAAYAGPDPRHSSTDEPDISGRDRTEKDSQ
jgi:ABC-type multidrug transport system ATPase subunit